jgi:hypothetical protein
MDGLTFAAIITTILLGIAANNADRAILRAISSIFRKTIIKDGDFVNHELKKALKRSFLSALQNIVLDCHKELYPHKFISVWPIYPPEHRDDLKWLDQKRDQLAKALKQLERENSVETPFASLEEIESLLNSTTPLATENFQFVKDKLIAEALKDDAVPECYEKKVKADLFQLVCNHFVWEIKYNDAVHSFFEAQLLRKINAQLTNQQLTMTNLENLLRSSQTQNLPNHASVATGKVTLDVDINDISTPQLLEIVDNFKKLGKDVTLKIRRIEASSVKLVLEGSQKGIIRIEELFKSGQLTEIYGIPIKDVRVTVPITTPAVDVIPPVFEPLKEWFAGLFQGTWEPAGLVLAPAYRGTEDKVPEGSIKRAKVVNLGEQNG